MSIRTGALALAGVMTAGFVATSLAAEETPGDVSITTDLTAVIALQGKPCGKVVSATRQGQDDYVASCEDGNRYRVSVTTDGRVIVAKLN